MLGATEFNNLIDKLPQLIELANKYDLNSISLIKAYPSDHVQIFVGISHAGPMLGLDARAKIGVAVSKLFGTSGFEDEFVVRDKNSFDEADIAKFEKHYKPNEIEILRTDAEETYTTSPEKIREFAKRILDIDFGVVDNETEYLEKNKVEKRKLSITTTDDKADSAKLSSNNLFNTTQSTQKNKIERLAEEIDQLSDEELEQLKKKARKLDMKTLLESPKSTLINSGK